MGMELEDYVAQDNAAMAAAHDKDAQAKTAENLQPAEESPFTKFAGALPEHVEPELIDAAVKAADQLYPDTKTGEIYGNAKFAVQKFRDAYTNSDRTALGYALARFAVCFIGYARTLAAVHHVATNATAPQGISFADLHTLGRTAEQRYTDALQSLHDHLTNCYIAYCTGRADEQHFYMQLRKVAPNRDYLELLFTGGNVLKEGLDAVPRAVFAGASSSDDLSPPGPPAGMLDDMHKAFGLGPPTDRANV